MIFNKRLRKSNQNNYPPLDQKTNQTKIAYKNNKTTKS